MPIRHITILWTNREDSYDYLVRGLDYFTQGPVSTVTSQGVLNKTPFLFQGSRGAATDNQRDSDWVKLMDNPPGFKGTNMCFFDI